MPHLLASLFRIFFPRRPTRDDAGNADLTPPGRGHSWDMLLAAHGRYLNLVSAFLRASRGETFLSMASIRAQGTSMFVAVYSMLRHLRTLSGTQPSALDQSLYRLQTAFKKIVAGAPSAPGEALILPLTAINAAMSREVGTKMAFLGEIRARFTQVHVPDGFVITSTAFHRFLDHNGLREEINRRLQTLEIQDIVDMFRVSSELQMLIIKSPLPEQLSEAILAAYRDLEARAGLRGVRVAVRSSAVGEDSMDTSFAGQYRTELNVSEDLLFMAYKEVVASKYSLTAISYRLSLGLKDEDLPMCVGCMVMEDVVAAGTMYTQDPTSQDAETLFVDAVHGLGKAVTDGYVSPDHWEISKQPDLLIREQVIRAKHQKFVTFLAEEGATLVAVPPAQRLQPALSPDQVLALSRLGLVLENHFLCPLDIQWSLDRGGRVCVLQARPLKRVMPRSAPATNTAADSTEIIARGGQTVSPGIAGGPVFHIRAHSDMLLFPDGGVLVAAGPSPGWSALVPRAAAVVTEQGGGIFGHLANIAREFGVPALFDVQNAATLLQPGMRVLVNASQRTIHAIPSGSDPKHPPSRINLVGTPVHRTLAEAMEITANLSRVNPLAPRLDPDGLATLRDISQAANLLAVEHTLRLAALPGKLRKLDVSHPVNWWLLDLDDPAQIGPNTQSQVLGPVLPQVHPLLDACWRGIALHPWTLFRNLTHENALAGFLLRLRATPRLISPPKARLFITARNSLHFFLSLGRGLFIVQVRNGEPRTEQAASLLWHWRYPKRPSRDWLEGFRNTATDLGLNIDTPEDGLLLWSAGEKAGEIGTQAELLCFLIGYMQQWRTLQIIPDHFRKA